MKPPALHRLNRSEYRNSVRELLDIDVDVSGLLRRIPESAASITWRMRSHDHTGADARLRPSPPGSRS